MDEPEKLCSRCGQSYSSDVIFCPKDGTPLGARKTEFADDPYVGLRIAGQFQIEQLIGIGAMGRVYRAHQAGIERSVAIKILHRDLLRNATVISRFHREAKVASRLSHPNVVQVLMTGELERSSADVGGEGFLVMEFLDGISLRSALAAAGGALPLPRALHVMLQVCDAVGEGHAQGIVHRDLKPENVMLVRRGDDADFVKVLDFGVARIDWADSSVATQAGVIFGTARYISPEGAQGGSVGAPADVYSAATLLFQCLSGQTPFDGESPVSILIKHTSQAPPDVRSLPRSSYVPEPIARVIAQNLAKDPSERCRDARELGRALVEAARASGLSPDDLLVRSTLLGGRSLQMASMERTRQLGLTPDLEAKLTGRPGETELVEAKANQVDAGAKATSVEDGPRTSITPETPSGSMPRSSRVEPTMSDEPATPSVPPPRPSLPAPLEAPVSVPRASDPRFSIPPQPAAPTAGFRWIAIIASCFVLGVGLTLGAAHRLGAFADPEAEMKSTAARAEAALSKGAWDTPPGENVKQITAAALKRWPNAEPVLDVRRRAARTLVKQAAEASANDAGEARRLVALALELDPTNAQARLLDAELATAALRADAVAAPEPATPPQTQEKPARAKRPAKASTKAVAPPPAVTSPPAAPAPRPAPPPTSDPGAAPPAGRWL